MAGAAKRLESVRIERVLARLALQWQNVITFKPTSPAALDTAPAVALKDKASDGGPAVGIQVDVAAAHLKSFDLRKTHSHVSPGRPMNQTA